MTTRLDETFRSARLAIWSAKTGITDLNRDIRAYYAHEPYTRRVDVDPDTGEHVHKIVLTEPVPGEIEEMASGVFGDLRKCLDRATSAIGRLHGLSNSRLRNLYFPFAGSAGEFNETLRSRCKGLPEPIKALYRSFDPYRGGDDALWALNHLARVDKHHDIVPIGQYTGAVNFGHINAKAGGLSLAAPRWDAAKHELVFMRCSPDTEVDYRAGFAIDIVVKGVGAIPEAPLMNLLGYQVSRVESIIDQIESTCVEIGLSVIHS